MRLDVSRLSLPAVVIVLIASLSACSASSASSSAGSASSAAPAATSAAPTAVASAASTPWPSVVALPTELPAAMTFDQMLPLFSYAGTQPFNVTTASSQDQEGVTVKDITFTGAAGEPIDAYLILPAGNGPFPAVLFEHMAGGTRDEFVTEATALAGQHHIAGLLVTRPTTLDNASNDTVELALQIREMRRALDYLASQPQVDPARLGYVGHSMGAIYGLSLLAIEPRIKTAALMAPVPGQIGLDVTPPHVTGPTVLFQYGNLDSLYTKDDADRLAALVPATHTVTWYDAGHGLNDAAQTDRAAWLTEKLAAK